MARKPWKVLHAKSTYWRWRCLFHVHNWEHNVQTTKKRFSNRSCLTWLSIYVNMDGNLMILKFTLKQTYDSDMDFYFCNYALGLSFESYANAIFHKRFVVGFRVANEMITGYIYLISFDLQQQLNCLSIWLNCSHIHTRIWLIWPFAM